MNLKLHSEAILHSDQGVHYTSPKFQKQVQQLGLKQSMSMRGNCWDNAPQESFFGHFKDEVILSKCSTLEEVIKEIDDYMDYYNNYRYQWNLSKNDSCSVQKSSCFLEIPFFKLSLTKGTL